MSDLMPMIEAVDLSKFYGPFMAVDKVSFKIFPGEVVAFLGPNGAGKSTTMRMLTGYLAPTSGEARIGGLNVFHNRVAAARMIGYLPENGPLYPEMTPRETLHFFGEARGLDSKILQGRMHEVVQLCALSGVMDKPVRKLSKGFRQRLGMAQVLLHEPEVIIMDEPTSGLDPNQIKGVRETLRQLGKKKTILLSTHILQEVEAVASRVIMIHGGRIVFDGTPEALRSKGQGNLDQAFYALTGVA